MGLNVRVGPGTSYKTAGRFDAQCAIGLDGYCIGEAVADTLIPGLTDVRWLRLRHSHEYVAAGQVVALRSETLLGERPEDSCPEGLAEPFLDDPVAFKRDDGLVRFKVRPVNTQLVGMAVRYVASDEPEEALQLGQLGITPKLVRDSGVVRADLGIEAHVDAVPSADHLEVVFVPCLAAIVPAHGEGVLFRVNLADGSFKTLPWEEARDLDRLTQFACRLDPTASAEDILAAANR